MKVGDRVGAILQMDGESVHFIGYGTLIERETPGPEAVGFMVDVLREGNLSNPTILLDSGEKVWGCECWFSNEERVQKLLSSRVVIPAPPSEWRKEASA